MTTAAAHRPRLVATGVAAAALALTASPALGQSGYTLTLSGPPTATVGSTVLLGASGSNPPTDFFTSWLDVYAIPTSVLSTCPSGYLNASQIASSTGSQGGGRIANAQREDVDEQGRFSMPIAYTPDAPGTFTICGYTNDGATTTLATASLTMTVQQAAAPGGGGGGGSDPGGGGAPGPGDGGTAPGTGSPPGGFTLSAAQLLINQRIGQAAIRRLNAIEAHLDGRPAPAAGRPGRAGSDTVTLSAAQLRINQRIYQAGVRRANTLEARANGRPAPAAPRRTASGTVRLTVAQLAINQRIAQAAVRRANELQERVGL